MSNVRIKSIDVLRGIAILGVIGYHFLFDLDFFGLMKVNFDSIGMLIFEFLVQIIFLGLVGISVFIVFQRKNFEGFVKFQAKRFWIIMFWAIMISLATLLIFEEEYIRFGILHLIAASILILILVARYRWSQWVLLISVVGLGFWFEIFPIFVDSEFWVSLGVHSDTFSTVDYFPLIPWLIVPLIGFMTAKQWIKFFEWLDLKRDFEGRIGRLLRWMGRKSLWVYLAHQPILYAIFWVLGHTQ